MPMSDADELRLIGETVAMMNKHTGARLREIADRVEALELEAHVHRPEGD